MRARQIGRDRVEAGAIGQQRVKQKQRGPLPGLRGIDRTVGEESIHGLAFFA
jgi:hypothetical protein